jgi:uncharacterized protein YjdB/pimeloyl-ACP methyl ester carboxylesterase
MMKRLKKTGLSLLIAFFCCAGYAQTVSEVEWWFDNQYGGGVQRSSIGGSDVTWTRDISTNTLNEGLHILHIRLKDNSGRYSGISSDYFFKFNRSTPGSSTIEYWFDGDFDNRKQESIPTDGTVGFEWPTTGLGQGLHTVSYRTGYAPGAMGSVHSDYFFKLNSGSARGPKRLVYWFDDRVEESAYRTLDGNQTLASLDIDAGQLTPGGHVLHMRLGYENGGYTATTTDFFVHGANPYGSGSASASLTVTDYTYWFDKDAENSVSVSFNQPSATVNLVEDISTTSLTPDETHTFNIRFDRNDGKSVLLSEKFTTTGSLICYAPSLLLSRSELQPGENMVITGKGFVPDGEVRFYFTQGIETVYTTQADAKGRFEYALPISGEFTDREYALYARDMASGKTTAAQRFNVRQPDVKPLRLPPALLYPNADGLKVKEGESLPVKWRGYIHYPAVTGQKYRVELVAIHGNSETVADSKQNEGNYSEQVTALLLYETEFFPEQAGTYKIRISDLIHSISVEGKTFTVEPQSGFVTMRREWDYSLGAGAREGYPKGLAADGVSRIYLTVESKEKTIDSMTVSLGDGKNTTTVMLGKIMEAGVTGDYSDENVVKQTTTSTMMCREKYYFWYVAPDGYTDDPNDRSSSRFVNAVYHITYSDGTTSEETQQIEIVRPPVMLVHGLGSNSHCWDNFSLDGGTTRAIYDKTFKLVRAVDMYASTAFSKNADVLLGLDPYKTQSSFQSVLKQFRKTGYAASRVDYICHSMGGCILRYAEEHCPQFYDRPNYNEGYINTVITIDTPHNGSPWADLVERLTNWLYDDVSEGGLFDYKKLEDLGQGSYGPGDNQLLELNIKRKSLGEDLVESIYWKGESFLSAFFKQKTTYMGASPLETSWIYVPTDAVLDLRTSSGGVRFHETPLRSHLIVGDIFPGYPNNGLSLNAIDGMFEADTYYAAEIEKFEIFLDAVALVKFYLADPSGKLFMLIDEANNLLKRKDLKNRNLRVMELCHQILSIICILGEETENFILDSDGVVSCLSQSAGLNGDMASNVSFFEGMRSNHMTVVDKKEVGETVQQLLNASIHSQMFKPIPASPLTGMHTGSFQLRSTPEPVEVSISEDENRLQILNIEQGMDLAVGNDLQVSIRITGLEHLKRLQLTFQGKNYYAPEFAEYVTFDIPVTGYNLQTQSLYVKAYYDDGSSAWMVYATKEVNVTPKEKAVELYTDEEVYYLSVNETVRPLYTIVFPDFIFTGRHNTDIKASVADEEIVVFDPATDSYVAGKAGVTAVELTYEDVGKTIYFVVEAPVYEVVSVSLNHTQLELQPEQTGQLVATVNPANATNRNVTWSSSNTGIATVNNGLVTGVAAGTATITVTTGEGGKTATCEVTVVPVPSLSVSPSSVQLAASGGQQTFGVTSNVSWTASSSAPWLTVSPASGSNSGTVILTASANSSSATRTATVTVSGAGVGNRTVTVTQETAAPFLSVSRSSVQLAASGGQQTFGVTSNVSWTASSSASWLTVSPASGSNSGTVTLTASANSSSTVRTTTVTVSGADVGNRTVTVTQETPSAVYPAFISLNRTEMILVPGETEQLWATVLPGNATDRSVIWSSSDQQVAGISSDGRVTAVADGYADITAETVLGGLKATCAVTVESPSGNESIEASQIWFYKSILTVRTPATERIDIYSVSGLLLCTAQKETGEATFDLSDLPHGVLIARGSSGWVKKIVR